MYMIARTDRFNYKKILGHSEDVLTKRCPSKLSCLSIFSTEGEVLMHGIKGGNSKSKPKLLLNGLV